MPCGFQSTIQIIGRAGLRVVKVEVSSSQELKEEVERIRYQSGVDDFVVLGHVQCPAWTKELLESVHMLGKYNVIVVHREKKVT